MLYELYVENFALIRQLRLNLTEGMTALTGETGAGKSLIVDAVSLLIGGRGSDSFIRGGQDRCVIEGVFLPPFPAAVTALLQEQGLDPEDSLLLSRELIRGGRGLARINGRVAPISRLREIGRLLINIHGQHEYTLLLEEDRQLHLLDSFGGPELAQALSETEQTYRALVRAKRQLTAYVQQRDQRRARMELLAEMLQELDDLAPEPGEDQRLEEESRVLSHGEKLYAVSSDVYDQLRGSSGAVDRLDAAYGELRHGAELDPSLRELLERLHSLYYEADDVAGELAAYRDRISMDAYRLDQVESRIAALNRVKKKYGGSLEAVLAEREQARQEYAELEEIDLSGEAYQAELDKAKAAYGAASGRLTHCREQAAAALGEAITWELQGMCMANALFSVDLPHHGPTAQGNEQAVFMIRPNLGEATQPVSKIASGGELSRILLGIKVILSGLDGVPVLIFDEIDTGLSGRALVAVAERLALVGKSAQTLAVSHAPVMAAAADNQIMIEKHEEEGRTVMEAHPLDQEQRIGEIARMIAGSIVTPASHQQALDLLNQMHRS